MTPPLVSLGGGLGLLSVLCGFVLKTTLGYGLCAVLAGVATTARLRFVVWLSFLLSTTAYWAYSLASVGVGHTGTGYMQRSTIAYGLPITLSVKTAELVSQTLTAASILYVGLLFILAISGSWNRFRLARVLRLRKSPSDLVLSTFAIASAKSGAPLCEVWLLPGLTSPAALGWISPKIYLPAEEVGAESYLDDVLWHELAHVRRRDSLWDSISRLCRWFVFFHPVVQKAYSSLRLEREMACDSLVVQRNPERRDRYAETLVRFGWKTSVAESRNKIGVGFTSQAGILNARVRSILKADRVQSRWSTGFRALLSTSACCLFISVAPALWISFGLSMAALQAQSFVSPKVSVVHQTLRSKQTVAKPRAVAESSRSMDSVTDNTPLAQTFHGQERRQAFHVQNAEEPMSNPAVDSYASDDLLVDDRPGQGNAIRPALPSAMAVLVNTASQVARMGAGHDHDHGHE